jgi:hypothetical protein
MFQLKDSTLSFKKGAKPQSIKQAQKQVREVYMNLCQAGAPRSEPVTKLVYFDDILKTTPEKMYSIAPSYKHAIDSGVQAYCRTGETLMAHTTMFSMDIFMPAAELALYPGVSPELLEAAAKLPTKTVLKVQAREF